MSERPAPTSVHARPSSAWWAYFAILALFAVGGMASFALQARAATVPAAYRAIAVVATVLNLLGLLGLLLYILQRPWIERVFWQGVFGLTVLQFLFSASQFARVLGMPGRGNESSVALVGLVSLAIGLPLLFVLWTYAFRSPGVWRR